MDKSNRLPVELLRPCLVVALVRPEGAPMAWPSFLATKATLVLALDLAYSSVGDYVARVFTTTRDAKIERIRHLLILVHPVRHAPQSDRGSVFDELAVLAGIKQRGATWEVCTCGDEWTGVPLDALRRGF